MKGFIASFLLLLLHTIAIAKPYNPDNLPVQHSASSANYICNPDNILSAHAADSLNRMLYDLEKSKGVKTLVIVIKDIEGDDAYEFSIGVGNKHGVGSKQNTGLIVTLATEDRCYYILTGEGLEKHLPDAICKRVENRVMVPHLKQGDWDGAMVATVAAIKGILEGDEELVREYTEDNEEDTAAILFATLFIIVGCFMLFAFVTRQANKCPKCGKRKLKAISNKTYTDRQGIRHTNTILICQNCGKQVNRDQKDDPNDHGIGGGPFIGGIPMGGGRYRGGGGSFGGGGGFGSFGGGSFGGGGAGGRF
jgi:uncharacterized protein